MAERYLSVPDMCTRLDGCVIRYKGRPVWSSHYGKWHLSLQDLITGDTVQVDGNTDDDLDLTSAPIGYVNFPHGCYYISRAPHRKFKQGLTTSNCSKFFEGPQEDDCWSIRHIIPSLSLGSTILNQFPTPQNALNDLRYTRIPSVAFNRRFAFMKDEAGLIKLRHMTRTIGWVDPKTSKLTIPPELSTSIFDTRLSAMGLQIA